MKLTRGATEINEQAQLAQGAVLAPLPVEEPIEIQPSAEPVTFGAWEIEHTVDTVSIKPTPNRGKDLAPEGMFFSLVNGEDRLSVYVVGQSKRPDPVEATADTTAAADATNPEVVETQESEAT